MYVAQPCSYASEQERTESFFSPLPLSFVPRMLATCGMRGAVLLLPHSFGGSELAKLGVVVGGGACTP